MAAWQESPEPLVVDLRKVSAADLTPLLEEETGVWQRALDWDFEPSAELVRRFVDMQALSGFALLEGGARHRLLLLHPRRKKGADWRSLRA